MIRTVNNVVSIKYGEVNYVSNSHKDRTGIYRRERLTLNQQKFQPALHRGNILSVNLKETSSGHVQENPKRTQAYRHPEPAPVTPTVSSVFSAPQKHDIPVLRNVIQKGQKVRIGTVGQLPKVRVALGWNVSNPQCDIDLSAYLLDASGKVPGDDWLFFTDRH